MRSIFCLFAILAIAGDSMACGVLGARRAARVAVGVYAVPAVPQSIPLPMPPAIPQAPAPKPAAKPIAASGVLVAAPVVLARPFAASARTVSKTRTVERSGVAPVRRVLAVPFGFLACPIGGCR